MGGATGDATCHAAEERLRTTVSARSPGSLLGSSSPQPLPVFSARSRASARSGVREGARAWGGTLTTGAHPSVSEVDLIASGDLDIAPVSAIMTAAVG